MPTIYQDEIRHISEIQKSVEKPKTKRKILQFTKVVNTETGLLNEVVYKPEMWDNVAYLSGNLFVAWDNELSTGTVFLGKWVDE